VTTILGKILPFVRDAPTQQIVLNEHCPCSRGVHSYTLVSEEHFTQLTLRRYACTCDGCVDCGSRRVRVFPPTLSAALRPAPEGVTDILPPVRSA